MTNLVILDGIGYIQTGDKLVSATPAEYVAEIERLRAQLPAEMQHCTIRFIECEKGHGRLVGTNWIDPGCLKCEVDRLSQSPAEPAGEQQTIEGECGNCHRLWKVTAPTGAAVSVLAVNCVCGHVQR